MDILFLAPHIPFPVYTKSRTGGIQLRNFHFLRELAARGHKIDFISFCNEATACQDVDKIRPYCESIETVSDGSRNQGGGAAVSRDAYRQFPTRFIGRLSTEMQRAVDEAVNKKRYDAIHVSTIIMAPYVHRYFGRRIILDCVDSFSLYRWRERPLWRHLLARDWDWPVSWVYLWRYERWLANKTSGVVYVSQEDAQILPGHVRAKVEIIPMGVSFDQITTRSVRDGEAKKDWDVLFVGDLSFGPNREAASILLRDILPRIRESLPQVRASIVGPNPPDDIVGWAGDSVQVTGYVEDVASYFARSTIFVCPMRRGAGIKIKLIEAMASRLPIVATELAVSGLGGQDNAHYLIANSTRALAVKAIRLLKSPDQRAELAENAYQLYAHRFVWEAIGTQLENCYQSA